MCGVTLREYKLDLADPIGSAKTKIQMFRDQLIGYRGISPLPDELEWEIRLYDFMLEDPVTRLEQYNTARMVGHTLRSKRAVAKDLGWEVA